MKFIEYRRYEILIEKQQNWFFELRSNGILKRFIYAIPQRYKE